MDTKGYILDSDIKDIHGYKIMFQDTMPSNYGIKWIKCIYMDNNCKIDISRDMESDLMEYSTGNLPWIY